MTTSETPPVKPDTKKVSEPLRFDLTDHEIAQLARKLTVTTSEQERNQSSFDSLKLDYKSRNERFELELSDLRRRISEGFEMRDTECEVSFNDPERGMKTTRRLDTGATVRVEKMTPLDIEQRELPGIPSTVQISVQNPDTGEVTSVTFADIDTGQGQTNVGNALTQASAKTNQPRLILDLDAEGWTDKGLRAAFKTAAKKAKWDAVAISTMTEVLSNCADVEAMKRSLREHCDKRLEPAPFYGLPKLIVNPGQIPNLEELVPPACNAAVVANWPLEKVEALRSVLGECSSLDEARDVLRPLCEEVAP